MTKSKRRIVPDHLRYTEHSQSGVRQSSDLRWMPQEPLNTDTPVGADERLVQELRTHHVELELQNQELRLTQGELLCARDELADLYDHAPVGFVTTDHDGLVLAANLKSASLLGQPRDALVGHPLSDFIDPADQDVYYLHRRALRKGNPRQSCELRMRRAGGEVFWVGLESVAVHDRQGGACVRSAVTDITDRKQAEQEQHVLRERLQHLQKMEALGTLAGGIAHDVNNILTVIQVLGSRLERDLPADDARRQDIRDIVSAVFRGRKLTQNLLDFAHSQPRKKQVCHPNDVIGRLIALLDRTAPKRVAIQSVVDQGIASVECDPDQLTQMLMNACVNSIDAIAGHGTITIRTSNVSPEDEELGGLPELPAVPHVRIEITDDGSGMDGETQRRAFEPFFTTKDVGKGTGLGLSMVYSAVQELGGAIRISSQLGGGTTLCILLPAYQSSRAPRSWIPDSDDSSVAGGTVLVVDDEPLVRAAFTRALKDFGYCVITADGGPSALEAFRAAAGSIDVVLLDLSMPNMDGAECYARLKEIDPAVRVVFCTGHARAEAAQRLGVDGMPSLVTKPCTSEELASALAKALRATPPMLRLG